MGLFLSHPFKNLCPALSCALCNPECIKEDLPLASSHFTSVVTFRIFVVPLQNQGLSDHLYQNLRGLSVCTD